LKVYKIVDHIRLLCRCQIWSIHFEMFRISILVTFLDFFQNFIRAAVNLDVASYKIWSFIDKVTILTALETLTFWVVFNLITSQFSENLFWYIGYIKVKFDNKKILSLIEQIQLLRYMCVSDSSWMFTTRCTPVLSN